jgi:hypothetical protein
MNTIVTRGEAHAQNLPRYFTGKPCAHGHTAERYSCNAMCIPCSEIHRLKPRAKKPATPEQKEKGRLKAKAYHEANRELCLAKMRERNAVYYTKNKERIKAQTLEYQRTNNAARNAYKAKWMAERAKTDAQFAALLLMRKLIARSLARVKQKRKQSERTTQILGYTQAEFVAHFERLFKPGMTWANHGEWEADHRRPLSSFDLTDPEELRKANSLHNLQPLWKAVNQKKSDSWSGQYTII